MSENQLIDTEIVFNEGDMVDAELGDTMYRGFIRGVGTRGGVLRLWIVELTGVDQKKLPPEYPYSCILVPHTAIKPAE